MADDNVIILLEFNILHSIGQQSWEHLLDALINGILLLVEHNSALGDLSQWHWHLWNKLESVKLVLREVAIKKTKLIIH